MLKIRVMPTLLFRDVELVKGIGFDAWRRVGSILPAVRIYNLREVDELVFLDIAATSAGRPPDLELVGELAAECRMPLTVGGGIRNARHVEAVLRAGADKVCVNTATVESPEDVASMCREFGSQCIVGSLDARPAVPGGHEVFIRSGRVATGRTAVDHARALEQMGCGEIVVTSIPRDGTLAGYDTSLVADVARAVAVPVVASGGAGEFSHFAAALEAGASAVAAASIFHFTQATPREAKVFLAARGFAVRLPGTLT